MQGVRPQWRRALDGSANRTFALAAGSCLVMLVAAYGNSLGNAFHFDDSHVVVNNVYIRNLANAPHFFTDVRMIDSLPQNQAYRPLVTLSLAMDYFLGHGLSTRVFHLDQLFLLIVLGTTLFFFYLRVMDSASPGPANRFLALFSATLFCVHTVNTETMNLMHVRSEILSAIGLVAGFLVYLGHPRLRRFQVHLLPMAIGALAKSPAVVLAPLLFAWELIAPPTDGSEARSLATRVKTALRVSAPAFAVGLLLFWFIEKHMPPPSLDWGGGDRIGYVANPNLGMASLSEALRSPDRSFGGHGPRPDSLLVRHARRFRSLRNRGARLGRFPLRTKA